LKDPSEGEKKINRLNQCLKIWGLSEVDVKVTIKFGLVVIVVFSLSGLFSCLPSEEAPKEEKWDIKQQKIEKKALDFTLEDLDGNTVKLSDFKDQGVLLVFTTTWCSFCRKEIPRLKQIYAKYKEKGLEIINIDIQESKDKVSAYTLKHKLPYTVLLDTDAKIASMYGVRGVPTQVLISKNGTIVCFACRSIDIMLESLFNT
jgi:peroxiredoxin